MTVDQLIFSSLSVLWVWNRCRWPISSPAGGRTSTDLNRVRAAGGWKSGKIMIIIMETYNSVGHSLNHREKKKLLPFFINEPTDLYLYARRRNEIFERRKKLFSCTGFFSPPPFSLSWKRGWVAGWGCKMECRGLSQGLLTPGEVQNIGSDSQATLLFPARL